MPQRRLRRPPRRQRLDPRRPAPAVARQGQGPPRGPRRGEPGHARRPGPRQRRREPGQARGQAADAGDADRQRLGLSPIVLFSCVYLRNAVPVMMCRVGSARCEPGPRCCEAVMRFRLPLALDRIAPSTAAPVRLVLRRRVSRRARQSSSALDVLSISSNALNGPACPSSPHRCAARTSHAD